MSTRNGRIPMDLTDPYYGQFWPNGVVMAQSTKTVLGYNEAPYGCLGTFNKTIDKVRQFKDWPVPSSVPVEIMAPVFKNYRQIHHLTRREMARQTGLSHGHIWNIEKGSLKTVEAETVERCARSLGLTVDEFLAYADKP